MDQAIRLFAAAERLRTGAANTTSWAITDQAQCEGDIAVVRAAMRGTNFQSAWAEG